MLAKLKIPLVQLNFCCARGRHWNTVDRQPTTSASAVFISATATRMNGRFTDMIPVTPGSFTRNLAAMQATTRKETNRTALSDAGCRRAFTTTARPETTIRAIKKRADLEDGMLVFSILWAAKCRHTRITPRDGCAPNDAEAGRGRVAPGNGVAPQDGIGKHCVASPDQRAAPDDGAVPDDAVTPGDGSSMGQGDFARQGVANRNRRSSASIDYVVADKCRVHVEVAGADGECIVLRKVRAAPEVEAPAIARIAFPCRLH